MILILIHPHHPLWDSSYFSLPLFQQMRRHARSFWPCLFLIEYTPPQLVKRIFPCLGRRPRLYPTTSTEHWFDSRYWDCPCIHDLCFVPLLILLQRLHLPLQPLLLLLFLVLRLLLKLSIHLAPILGISRLMRLLVPVGNVTLDVTKPDLAGFADYLGGVGFYLLELVRILYVFRIGAMKSYGRLSPIS